MNRRQNKWAISTVLTLLLCLSQSSLAKSPPKSKTLFQNGQLAETQEDPITAYEDYYQAWKLEPKNLRYKTAYERLRFLAASAHVSKGEKLLAQNDTTGAVTEFLRAMEIDPSNELARQDIQKARDRLSTTKANQETSIPENKAEELSEVGSPVQLKPISNEPLTLHMTEDSKVVYQTVGKAAGINVLFDPEYTSKRIQVDIANVSLLDALRIVGVSSGTFWHPVTSNTIFVAMNTRAKRQELEEEAVQTFYLANTAQQNDLNDIQTALRNLLVNAKLYGVPSQSAIVMRATPDELLLAQKLINDLDKSRPEVVVDVALLEVNRDKTRTLGIQLPGSFGIQLQPPNATSTTSTGTTDTTTGTTTTGTTTNLTLNNLAHLNATNFAVTVGAATANFLLSDSDTKILQNPSIRATDGQKADLKVGSRIPVATGSYQTGAATAVVSSLVNTQFTYMDVGVEIEITPIVHYDRDVTLKIKLVSSQEQSQVNIGGITEPIISQRTADQVVRLKEGEVNILGGFLQKQDLISIGGTPGLGELPILKYIFSSTQHEVQDDEIIFMITPHVVRATDINPLNLQEIDTGTGTNVELRRISAPGNRPNGQATVTDGLPPGLQPHTGPPPPDATPAAAGTPGPATPGSGPTAAAPPSSSVSLQIVPPPATPKVGSTFKVAVNLSGGQDIFSVPMQLRYDNSKLALINVDTGDYLGHDGQAIALVHRDDGVGNVVISASRPPGVAGVTGSGTVCVLTFQANAAGDAALQIIRASAKNSAQQAVNIAGSQTAVRVQ
jgi:general secretion pathway protein D